MSTTPTEKYLEFEAEDIGFSDEFAVIFGELFDASHLLHERNKYILLYLNSKISEKEFDVIKNFLGNSAIMDLHASILKSILLITESIKEKEGIEPLRTSIDARMRQIVYNS